MYCNSQEIAIELSPVTDDHKKKKAQISYLRLMCLKYYSNFSGWVVE